MESIKPGMKLNKNFFMRIYAYELTWTGFKDVAIKQLNDAGCSHALEYYNQIVGEYEKEQEQTLKEVAHWYRQQCNADYERKKKDAEVLEKCQQAESSKAEHWQKFGKMLNYQ